eukprot:6481286-Prymnesium_polylepis.1
MVHRPRRYGMCHQSQPCDACYGPGSGCGDWCDFLPNASAHECRHRVRAASFSRERGVVPSFIVLSLPRERSSPTSCQSCSQNHAVKRERLHTRLAFLCLGCVRCGLLQVGIEFGGVLIHRQVNIQRAAQPQAHDALPLRGVLACWIHNDCDHACDATPVERIRELSQACRGRGTAQ